MPTPSIQRAILASMAALTIVSAPSAQREPTASRQRIESVASLPPTLLFATSPPRHADFRGHRSSLEARHVADWVADSANNAGADFVILDKRRATLYVFDAEARLRGSTPVLLGAALGDASVPGIGTRPIAEVQPHERTTPAGRFVAERGHNAQGEDVVWVDYDAAVSMHRVRATVAKERRLQRLASKTVDDNRISYGCINVPVAFYEAFVRPTFASRRAIVYVLPEHTDAAQVFGSYDVASADAAAQGLALRR